MGGPQARRWRVRPAVAAFPFVVLAAVLSRQLFVGVGADEFSLLRMGEVLRAGAFPYSEYWDVRPPLAYFIALPSALVDDAGRTVALLRILAWCAHALAAYIFFCLFQRGVGALAAAVGAVALLATANATGLHASPLPNHFVMALAVVPFALVVVGRRRRRGAYLLSAAVVGALPWIMIHAAVVAGSLGLLALLRGPRRLAWLLVAASPSVIVVGAYWLWGPFDVFVRTVFGAPFAVVGMRSGYHFFSADALWQLLLDAPWVVVFAAVMMVGAVSLPGVCRAAAPGSALRLVPFLVLPLAAAFGLMAYAKPPAPPEYWVEMAPVVGLLAAVAAAKLFGLGVWERFRRPQVARMALALLLGALLALPVDPWREERRALPETFCRDAAARWLAHLRPADTVLDFTGLCGYQFLRFDARPHPPFAFAPMWLRMLDQPWIGHALAGDEAAPGDVRLRRALGLPPWRSTSAVLLADNRMLGEIRERGWMRDFHRHWRVVWFHRLPRRERSASDDQEDAFASLAILVRRSWEPARREEDADAALRSDRIAF